MDEYPTDRGAVEVRNFLIFVFPSSENANISEFRISGAVIVSPRPSLDCRIWCQRVESPHCRGCNEFSWINDSTHEFTCRKKKFYFYSISFVFDVCPCTWPHVAVFLCVQFFSSCLVEIFIVLVSLPVRRCARGHDNKDKKKILTILYIFFCTHSEYARALVLEKYLSIAIFLYNYTFPVLRWLGNFNPSPRVRKGGSTSIFFFYIRFFFVYLLCHLYYSIISLSD